MFKKIALGFLSFLFSNALIFLITGVSVNPLLYPDVYQKAFDNNGFYITISNQFSDGGVMIGQAEVKIIVDGVLSSTLTYVRGESDSATFDGKGAKVCEFVDCSSIFDVSKAVGKDNLDAARDGVAAFKKAVIASAFITVISLLLIIFLKRESFDGMAKWLGSNLLFSGIMTDLTAMLMVFGTQKFAPPEVSGIMVDVLKPVTNNLLIMGTALLAVGAILLIVIFFRKK